MKVASLVFPLFLATIHAAEPFRRMDAELEKVLDAEKVPGLAAAVVRGGEIVAAGVAGIRKEGSPEKVELEDRFHLGSCTKSMTAALAAMLVADGKIAWDTDCAEVFDDVGIHEDFRGATLKQLLSNTGGVPGNVPGKLWERLWRQEGTEIEQRMVLVRETLGAAPEYEPGKGTAYSNAGFSIAGAMLEKRTGRTFGELMGKRLFEPLGMKSAGFGAPAKNEEVNQPYGHVIRKGKLVAIDPVPAGDNPPAISPAGRVHASILDFARYVSFQLGASKDGPLGRKQLEELRQTMPGSGDYALGWVRAEREWAGGTAFTHTGTNTMFYAVMWLAPEKDFAVVAACNSGEGFGVCDAAVGMLIGEFLKD